MKRRLLVVIGITLSLFLLVANSTQAAETRFEVSYSRQLDNGPITGRVFVIISKTNLTEPRLQAGSYSGSV
jgi:hypothetical protein